MKKEIQSEQFWVEAFQNGEQRGLSYFFDLHYKPLQYFASRLIQDHMQAEDLVAECFVKLWKREREVRDAGNIKAFLYISCRNACLNYLRLVKTRTTLQEIYFNQLEHSENDILANIVETEVLGVLVQEINMLPDKCAEVFKLIYFEQKKTDEIAVELNISPKTVRNHKAKAIELLRAAILKKGISGSLCLAVLLYLNDIS